MGQLLQPNTRVHLVGIGGMGLSAIARVLHGWGHTVSGSDQQPSALTKKLEAEGITVRAGHHADWVSETDVVVVSSAVPDDNPEVIAARQRGIPVLKRDRMLAEMTANKYTIAVAGAHGKTTTSAMIAWILLQAGLDPTFIVGGILQDLGTNAAAGQGPYFVVEADEYDQMFLGLHPDVAVLTTLEHDHPDCYPSFDDMRRAFERFARQVADDGLLVVCGKDPETRRIGMLLRAEGTHVQTYGFDQQWDWWAEGSELGNSAAFEVRNHAQVSNGPGGQKEKRMGICALQVPGRHNVLNALASLAASTWVGVGFGTATAALTRFRGTARRFEVKGQAEGITVVDDYAHHPTELRATLAAAQTKFPGRQIWAVFQPHTYSRTAALLDQFSAAFDDADHVLVTSIYAARETDTLGVSGRDIVTRMTHAHAEYVGSLRMAVDVLLNRTQPGDVIITLGAGDGFLVGERVLEQLRGRYNSG